MSNLTENDKTLRPCDEDDVKTLRPAFEADATLRVGEETEFEEITQSYETQYTLKNQNYNVIDTISEKTGEAQVFLVENKSKQYALKLYYSNINSSPNNEILEIIKSTPNTGLLVDIIDYGIWHNPHNPAEERHYEIMTYCNGGSLDKLDLQGDEKRLCEIAVQMASSIDFCHKHGFIHRDIKPGNFLFADDSHQQLLLSDFGISVKCDENGICRTDQARTRIYAAPEMYYTVPGENVVEIDTKSDFYSLGMVLLCLWMGEKKFKEKEFELMKRKRSGDLPYPSDLSEHTLRLIKALTASQPEKRCDFNKIARWAQGEDPFDELSDQKSIRSFHIIFNAGKNQIAHSPEELAELMRQDIPLAIKYLYNGSLCKWLTDNMRPELVVDIENIVEKLYPKDQTAGLYATCYCLNPDMPYYDIQDHALTTNEEIARTLLDHFSTYQSLLANPNDQLFLFFNAHGLSQLTNDIAPLFKEKNHRREALRCLIYALDSSLPFEITDKDGHKHQCYKPDEIINLAHDRTFNDESWDDLAKESFLIWLTGKDKGLANKVRTQLRDIDKTQDGFVFGVLYNLNPKVSFELQLDEKAPDYHFTHIQIAEMLNQHLMAYKDLAPEDSEYERAKDSLNMLLNFKNSKLDYYLKSKSVYNDKIDWIETCFDFNSKENTCKCSSYDRIIATFKMIKGLDVQPFYHFRDIDKNISNLNDLKSIASKDIKKEMEHGYLKEWLAIFFHENPSLNLSSKFGYEQEVVKYIEFIGKLNNKDENVSSFYSATNVVKKNRRKVRFYCHALNIIRVLLGFLCFIPFLGFTAVLSIYGLPFTENPLPIFSGGILLIMGFAFSFMFFLINYHSILGSVLLGFIMAAIFYYTAYYSMEYAMEYAHYIFAGVFLLTAFYLMQICYFNIPVQRKAHAHLLNPGFVEMQLEPLHYAFTANTTTAFISSIGEKTLTYADYLKGCIRSLIFRSVLCIILVGCLSFLFMKYTPAFSLDTSHLWQEEAELKGLIGTWNGTFEDRNATLEITEVDAKNVKATISVQYSNLINEELKGTINTQSGTIQLDDVHSNGILDGQYNGTFTDGKMNALKGSYKNYTTQKQVEFNFEKATVGD